MRHILFVLAVLSLAGCGGGGGGGGSAPPPAGPTTYNLVASVWPPVSPGVFGGTVSIAGGTTTDSGDFAAGDVIAVTAHPDSGNSVATWSGSDDDTSTAASNTVTMPASNHQVEVSFMPTGAG